MKIMVTSFKRSVLALLHSVHLTLHQATAAPRLCCRFLDTHRQVWVSLLWGHCSFLLSPGACKGFVCALQECVSPVLCKLWWVYCRANGDFLQKGLRHTQICCTQSPCPHGSLLLTRTSTGDAQNSVSVSVGSLGPGVYKVCLSPLSISSGNGV